MWKADEKAGTTENLIKFHILKVCLSGLHFLFYDILAQLADRESIQ